MACVSPIRGFRTSDGTITLDRSKGFIDRPADISCGQCVGCKLSRAHMWATRICHEAQMVSEAGGGSCFVTLTYNEANLPADLSLNVRDWQLFAKKLRNRCGAFRFFTCGEYGDDYLRPHYHGIFFGIDFSKDRIPIGTNEHGDRKYYSPELSDIWGKGNCELGSVSWQSASYCAGYIVTKANGDFAEVKYRRSDGQRTWMVKPEFSVMSRRPGIGASWFDKYKKDVYPSDFVVLDGRRRRVPKYYDKLISDAELESIKSERVRKARNGARTFTRDRRDAREVILMRGRKPKGSVL